MSDEKRAVYGGQAVLEGVMMRGQYAAALAVRKPDEAIGLHVEPLGAVYRSRWARTPFVRGIVVLWDALALGMRMLTKSANYQLEEDEEELEGWGLYLTLAGSLAFSVALFMLTPAAVGHFAQSLLKVEGFWLGALVEGLVRIAILIGYIGLIGQMEDIKRVFRYHGAEHKTINAYEAGAELTPENVAAFPLEHPRCGTAFLLTVVLLSILLFTLFPVESLWLKFLVRLGLLLPLAGISYEYLRWTADHVDQPLVRWLIMPNMALQRMTTAEPDLAMLEVAIASFNAMREGEVEFERKAT
jgi:uncharacterized protein YqhQ